RAELHAGGLGPPGGLAGAEARVHQQGRIATADVEAIAARAGSQNVQRDHVSRQYVAASESARSAVNSTLRRGMTRAAIRRKPSSVIRSPSRPHASGGTNFGTGPGANTFAPEPMIVPVGSSVPMAVLAWSPIRLPRNVRPVSMDEAPASSRIGP